MFRWLGPLRSGRSAENETVSSGPRGRLFRKYVVLLVALVSLVLLVNAGLHFWFSYNENKTAAFRIQQEKARSAAHRIEEFIDEIERQLGWTTALQWAASPIEQRRFDYLRLLRQVPAITELIQLDEVGKEQLKVSRLSMDVVGSGKDYSQNPGFTEAQQHRVWFSPVYFRKESEPYMTIAMAQAGRDAGVTMAEVNLKLIWDVITGLKIGEHGYAYVVDRDDRLIAHPDISLVLRNTDLSTLPQVAAAHAEASGGPGADQTTIVARGISGNSVLTAHVPIPVLGWTVYVELPLREALAPLYGSALRSGALLILALGLAALAALFLARRMTVPIRQLQAGAARIGAGDLGRRIDIHTGDELESLAGEFNRMAADLRKSYADLEKKVEDRTAELKEALDQQTATAEILQAINSSPGDLTPVFDAMLEKAMRLCDASLGVLSSIEGNNFSGITVQGAPPELAEALRQPRQIVPGNAHYRLVHGEDVVQIEDITAEEAYRAGNPARRALADIGGARTALWVALRKDDVAFGAFVIYRREVRLFTDKQIALLQNFAAQ
ncbi:MAG: HAMP domain-containing protein, partial [Alphaproteobacteria bacterium]|nr:HAMP domain-containing protein [Alphaproteobacteria bacterium]